MRLPSSAVRRAPQPLTVHESSSQDLVPQISPSNWESPLAPLTCEKRGSASVLRSRFILEHDTSAQLHDLYEVDRRPLGEGGFGSVYKARLWNSTVVRAVKVIRNKRDEAWVSARKEAKILRRLDHPYICKLLEVFEGSETTALVMEYVEGQELFDWIHDQINEDAPLDVSLALGVMRQVFEALHYCHSQGVIHRDLKPENIMVRTRKDDGRGGCALEVKLIDFGLAVLRKAPIRKRGDSLMGTYCYLAPEVADGQNASAASDMWSCGMVLHALLLGGLPEDEVRSGDEPLNVHEADYSHLPSEAKKLLAALLQVDPALRPSAALAVRMLSRSSDSLGCEEDSPKPPVSPSQRKHIVNAFLSFHRSAMLRRAVLTALAMQSAGQKVAELREQFLRIDRDGNGKISRQELAEAFSQGLQAGAQAGICDDVGRWVEAVFDSIDTDGSDSIEYTEWMAAALQEGCYRCEAAVAAAFRVFDRDGSGKISVHEFARVVRSTPSEVAQWLPHFDKNGDGEIDLAEFEQLIAHRPEAALGEHWLPDSPQRTKLLSPCAI